MTLDPRAIAELERLLAEATAGPWEESTDEPSDVVVWGGDGSLVANVDGLDGAGDQVNASLIAAMRNALPDLLAERRELRARVLEEMANKHDDWAWAEDTTIAEREYHQRIDRLFRHYANAIRAGRIK